MFRKLSMFRRIVNGSLLVFALGIVSAHAGITQSNLVINKIVPQAGGLLIGFTAQPADCTTSYMGGHAFLATTIKDFDTLYTLVATAQVTGQPVAINYIDNGNCGSLSQLLSLTNVVVN